MMRRRNVLVSAYYAKNVGDDLFLKSLFSRYENIDWYLLTANRHYQNMFKDYPHVNILHTYRELGTINMFISRSKLTRHIKKYDAFVMIGGSIFIQNKGWKNVYSIRHQLIQLLNKYNIPSYIIGANFGPFNDVFFKEKYESHFKNYTSICFRDEYSYDLFKHLSNVKVAPDAVLTLNNDQLLSKKSSRHIGISLISLDHRPYLTQHKAEYYHFFQKVITHYLNEDYHIKLFSFCEEEGDLVGIKEILKLIPKHAHDKITVINYEGNIDAFLIEFKSCLKIIGTRFHSLILALKNRQPFIPVIYSEKMIEGLKQIGVKNVGYHIEDLATLNINKINSKFNRFINPDVFLKAEKQFQALDQLLKNE